MRRLPLLLMPVLLLLLDGLAATAQEVAPTSAPPQQWSSRIVNTDELSTSVPGPRDQGGTSVSTTTKPVAKKTRAKQTTTTSPPTSVAPPSAAGTAEGGIAAEMWLALRRCESGNRYDLNTGNGYYGAYQFALSTWQRLGLSGYPHQAPPAVQDDAARRLQAKSGWGVWPACSRRIGAR